MFFIMEQTETLYSPIIQLVRRFFKELWHYLCQATTRILQMIFNSYQMLLLTTFFVCWGGFPMTKHLYPRFSVFFKFVLKVKSPRDPSWQDFRGVKEPQGTWYHGPWQPSFKMTIFPNCPVQEWSGSQLILNTKRWVMGVKLYIYYRLKFLIPLF